MGRDSETPLPSSFFSTAELLQIPNLLTLLRVPLAVAFHRAVGKSRSGHAPLALLALAGLTDVLDGYIARRTGQDTATGAVLDPLADKFFALAVVSGLLRHRRLPRWGAAALLTREVLEAPLVLYMFYELKTGCAPPAGEVHASWPGKAATMAQYAAILAALEAPAALPALLVVAGAAGTVAGIAYWQRELARRAAPNVGPQEHENGADRS
jgi:cardiolipin synthase